MIEHCQACEGIVAAECGDGFDPCPGLDVPKLRVLPPRVPHIPDQCDHTMREREFATVGKLGCSACAVAELARLRARVEELEIVLHAQAERISERREEVKALRARVTELEEEDRQWEKHGLVEIVKERDRLRTRDVAAKEMAMELLTRANCDDANGYIETATYRRKLVQCWQEAGEGKP